MIFFSGRAFFRRAVTGANRYECAKNRDCEITKESRKTCQACRLKKCADAGMKSSWVMTEEEKMDKKMRATSKKSADGTPVPKAKPPPKPDNGAPPQAGTLQSYMARRKLYLHRKRRQNAASATVTSSKAAPESFSGKGKGVPKSKSVKSEVSDSPVSDHLDFIKMEEESEDEGGDSLSQTIAEHFSSKRRRPNNDENDLFSSDDNSYDDSYFAQTTSAASSSSSVAADKKSPSLRSSSFTSNADFSAPSLFHENNDHSEDQLSTNFSPISNDHQSSLSSPYPESKSVPVYSSSSISPSPSPGNMSYSPAPSSFSLPGELKLDPGFSPVAQSPLGCGDFAGLFGSGCDDLPPIPIAPSPPMEPTPRHFLMSSNNNDTPSTSTSASSSITSGVMAVYRKSLDQPQQRDNFIFDEELVLPPLIPVQPPTSNDLSLDVYPFDQVRPVFSLLAKRDS